MYNTDGTEDTGFRDNLAASSVGNCASVASQVIDGKYLIGMLGGSIFTSDNLGTGSLIRVNPDGTLDLTYAPRIQTTEDLGINILAIGIQINDYAVIGGGFGALFGISAKKRYNIARLSPTGEVQGPDLPA